MSSVMKNLPLSAFERVQVANPVTVFDAKLQYDTMPLLFESVTAGSGSVAHDADVGAVAMTVTTASGDKALRQSRQYCTYQAGKAQDVFLTGSFGTQQTGTRQRMGYYDDNNGVFLEQDGTGLYIVFRSAVSGTPVDTRVAQADWNLDTYEGLDMTNSQILFVDLQWLGVGLVRVGFDIGGKKRFVHQFYNDNRTSATYWTTATLPIRYEIENTDTAAAGTSMYQICCSVQSDGGFDLDKGFGFSCGSGTTIGVTTRRPVRSIRPKTTFNSITNRVGIIPTGFEVMADGNGSYVEIVYGGTLTGASWTDVNATHSAVECDVASTAISGGVTIWSGFVGSSGPKSSEVNPTRLPNILWLTNSVSGTTTTPLSIVCTSINLTSNVRSAMRWVEIR